MLDDLLINLYDISVLLLPIVGVIVLIALTVLIIRIIKVVNTIPDTMSKVNDTIDTTHASIQKLEAPLNTITGVAHTVDTVNKTATGIVGSVEHYAVENSGVIVDWAKGMFTKTDQPAPTEEPLAEEEDFGIYE